MSSPTRPAQRSRYGASGSEAEGTSGKVVALFAIAMLVLVLVMAGQAIVRSQSRPVTAEFVTQERVDDNTARLVIDVNRKDTTKDAYCIVFAVDYNHAEIGRREVVLPAGGEKRQQFAVDVPTRAPVTSGRIYGCSQDIPFYMDTSATYLDARA